MVVTRHSVGALLLFSVDVKQITENNVKRGYFQRNGVNGTGLNTYKMLTLTGCRIGLEEGFG